MLSNDQRQELTAICKTTANKLREIIKTGAVDATDEVIMPYLANDLASNGSEGFCSRATMFVYNAIHALAEGGENFNTWQDAVYSRIAQYGDGSMGNWWEDHVGGTTGQNCPGRITAQEMSGRYSIALIG